MSKRIVIALGGNALGNTAAEQLQLVTETAKSIVDLIAAGNEVVVAHGNGPQVGMINLGLSTAAEAKAIKADMPFPECGAMSEGYIGYHLQQAIGNELASRGMDKPVATIVTQTVVSKDDPAFQHWITDSEHLPCPNGESAPQTMQRNRKAMETVLAEDTDAVCVVHGGVIMAIMEAYARPKKDFYAYHIGNGECLQGVYDGETIQIK